jgi:hypothetical protein
LLQNQFYIRFRFKIKLISHAVKIGGETVLQHD